MINKELGSEDVYDPLQLRNASPTLGLRTPPVYGKDTATIPPIRLPTSGGSGDSGIGGLASGVASPVTKRDDQLLDGLPPGSPMCDRLKALKGALFRSTLLTRPQTRVCGFSSLETLQTQVST